MRSSLLFPLAWCACTSPASRTPCGPPDGTASRSVGSQFGNEGVPPSYPQLVALLSGRAAGDGAFEFLGAIASGSDVSIGGVLVAVDLDQDGTPELGAEVGDARSTLAVFSGDSVARSPGPEEAVAVISAAQDPEDPPRAVGDLDGDGIPDLAASMSSQDTPYRQTCGD